MDGERVMAKGFQEGSEPWRIENAVTDELQAANQIAPKASVTSSRVKAHCRYWIKKGMFYFEAPNGHIRYLRTGDQPRGRRPNLSRPTLGDNLLSRTANGNETGQMWAQTEGRIPSAASEQAIGRITAIYDELAEFYAELIPGMVEHAKGARILASPPLVGARVMFFAYQPGDSKGFAPQRRCDRTWPKVNEYAFCNWRLSVAVREIFSKEFLQEHTVVANVNFFRAPDVDAWKLVPKEVRKKVRKFSRIYVPRLIDELRPQAIVAIGFEAFNTLKPTNREVLDWRPNRDGKRLVSTGQRAGVPIMGVLHLTGHHRPPMDATERATIRARLNELIKR